jgi:iron complex transport system permease protein
MSTEEQRSKERYRITVIALLFVMFFAALSAVSFGHYSYDPHDVVASVTAMLSGRSSTDPGMDLVLINIRLPRMIAALVIGGALSLSGGVYQGVFKNPLVSPDLLGVSSGACVGAALAILLGLGIAVRQMLAFAFGLLAVSIAMFIPKLVRNNSNLVLVLAGIITSGFMSSVLGIMKFVADEETELPAIVFWQMGSLTTVDMIDVWAILPLVAAGAAILLALSWRLNILSFGEVEAKTLGMNVRRMRAIVIICASFLTASTVCISGTIGWIGLVIPHLSRLLVGSDHRRQLPVSLLLGGTFLLIIDTMARTISTADMPLSILTGLVGAPFYAWLLYRQRVANLL